MSFWRALILGIIQGLTEFLPVSSSGHLVLAQHFMGVKLDQNTMFEICLHLGTALAVLVFFRRKLWDLFVSLFSWKSTINNQKNRHNRTLVLYLAFSTAVTGLIYVLGGDFFESLFSKPLVVAIMLIVTGAVVYASDLARSGGIPSSQMGLIRSGIVGLAQGIAIIPGISRSGSTIAASLLAGVKRRDAAEYSFLLSIPAILGAGLTAIGDLQKVSGAELGALIGGFLASFAVGYAVIALLINLIEKARLRYFSYYCWAIALISLVLLLWGK